MGAHCAQVDTIDGQWQPTGGSNPGCKDDVSEKEQRHSAVITLQHRYTIRDEPIELVFIISHNKHVLLVLYWAAFRRKIALDNKPKEWGDGKWLPRRRPSKSSWWWMLAKKTKASTCLFVKCNPGNNRISGLSSGRLLETSLRIRVCVDTHMYSRRGSTGGESYGVCANTHARLKNFAVVSPCWPVCFILIGNFSNSGVSAGNMKFHCCACLRFHSRLVCIYAPQRT